MGVVVPRLVFLAFVGLTGSIIYNALYLQDLHGSALLTTAASAPRQVTTTPVSPPPVEVAKLPPPVSTDLPSPQVEEGGPEPLLKAVQRELAAALMLLQEHSDEICQLVRLLEAREEKVLKSHPA